MLSPQLFGLIHYIPLLSGSEMVVKGYKKSPQRLLKAFILRVEYGARTHDLLNHNQAL